MGWRIGRLGGVLALLVAVLRAAAGPALDPAAASAPGAAAGRVAAAGSYTVDITAAGFSPSAAIVTAGDQVTWVNQTGAAQLLESGTPFKLYLPAVEDAFDPSAGAGRSSATGMPPGSRQAAAPLFGPQTLAPGGRFSYTFGQAGTYAFFLGNALSVVGTVVVQAATATPTVLVPNPPTASPTFSATPTSTASATGTASPTASPTPSATPTLAPAFSATPTATATNQSLPPDPSTVAPPIDQSVATNLSTSTQFLYTGSNPIQTGVSPGTIQLQRAAVLRGKVLQADGITPLPGAAITILGHPEYGQTLSRADGMFDLAVNGGGPLSVSYALSGYLGTQRQVTPAWQGYTWLPNVALLARDPNATAITLPASSRQAARASSIADASGAMQVARGSVITDANGTRQAALLFPAGTTATMVLPNGTSQPLTSFHVRVTEYTVGANGPQAMPAALPPTSGYTYAVELSVDEADAAGGAQVFLSPAPIQYVEDFLNFPVGMSVPVGSYDRIGGQWVAAANGRVVKILSIDTSVSPAEAVLDVDGQGQPATSQEYQSLRITDPERQELATLYQVNATLWRTLPMPETQTGASAAKPVRSLPAPQPAVPRTGPRRPGTTAPGPLRHDALDSVGTGSPTTTATPTLTTTATPTLTATPTISATATATITATPPLCPPVNSTATPTITPTPTSTVCATPTPISEPDTPTNTATNTPTSTRTRTPTPTITPTITATYTPTNTPTPTPTASPSRFNVPWDNNWPYGPPSDAAYPNQPPASTKPPPDASTTRHNGSDPLLIQSQAVGDDVPVTGTGFTLHYQSDRQAGNTSANTLVIPLTGSSPLPADLQSVTLQIEAAGQFVVQTFPSPVSTALSYTFTWNGQDAYGRPAPGLQPVAIQIGYVYPEVYQGPNLNYITDQQYLANPFGAGSFGLTSGTTITGGSFLNRISTATLWQGETATIGAFDARGVGLGGWTLSPHQVYDAGAPALYGGDGTQTTVQSLGIGGVITTAGGTGVYCRSLPCGDGGPAIQAEFNCPEGVAVGPDGSVYVADFCASDVRKIDPSGIVTTVASYGNGSPGTSADLSEPWDVALGPDGSIYIASGSRRVLREDPVTGIITTFAGTGTLCTIQNSYTPSCGDGGPATQAQLFPTGLAVGPDGTVYVSDGDEFSVRRIGTDGIITSFAGNASNTGQCVGGGACGDGGPASQAQLGAPFGLALGPDGSLYIADWGPVCRVRRVGPNGIITNAAGAVTVASYGQCPQDQGPVPIDTGNGGPASAAQLSGPMGVTVAPDGTFYIVEESSYVVRRVDPTGIINALAGTSQACGTNPDGSSQACGDGGPAAPAQLSDPVHAALAPDGSLYVADGFGSRIRKVGSALPGLALGDMLVPSEDGTRIYEFDSSGRHLATLDALTGATLLTFGYDNQNHLSTITDANGNVTTIQHDGIGNPTAIVAPFGQTTALTVDPNGYLASIVDPSGGATQVVSSAGGLIATLTDPNGHASTYAYDTLGRLTQWVDAAGAPLTLARTDNSTGYSVAATSSQGRTSTYGVSTTSTGATVLTGVMPTPAPGVPGAQIQTTIGADASYTMNMTDGTTLTLTQGGDPRWGMMAPLPTSLTIRTPGGLTSTETMTRAVTLATPTNPLSLTGLTDTIAVNGRTYTRSFNASTRTDTSTSPAGRQVVRQLDAQGRLVQEQVATATPETVSYDSQGRIAKIAQGSQAWTYTYDAQGHVASRADALGDTTTYTYVAADRLQTATLPGGQVYRFGYDAKGNLVQVTMPSSAVHQIGYSPVDQPTSYTPPRNAPYVTTYSGDQQPTQVTLPSGRVETSTYDGAGRLVGTSYPEATVTYSYGDPTARVSSVSRLATGSTTPQQVSFTYDGDLTTGVTWNGPVSDSYVYAYDNNFFLTGVTLAGTPVALTNDRDGLAVQDGTFAITRAGPGGLASQIGDSTGALTYGYDGLGRPSSRALAVNKQSLYSLQLTYDSAGRVSQKAETQGGTTTTTIITYDANSQVTQVTVNGSPTPAEQYGYDANGNRTSAVVNGAGTTAAYDAQDRLTSRTDALGNNTTYTFDADGYLKSRGNDTFQYSARGELLQTTVGGQTVTYGYDGLGRRVSRTDTSGTTTYLYGDLADQVRVTASRDLATGVLTTYYYDDAGALYALQRGSSWYYVGADLLGTPRVVADASGNVVATWSYDSYGNVTATTGSFSLPIRFAGGLADPTTGLVRFGMRDYDPQAGRWTARDPSLYAAASANLYAYAGNDPVNLTDSTGLWSVGGSVYAGVGFGAKISWTSEGISWTVEAGVGVGGGVEVNPFGGLAETGDKVVQEGSLHYGIGSIGLGIKQSPCGQSYESEFKLGAGPLGVSVPFGPGTDPLEKPDFSVGQDPEAWREKWGTNAHSESPEVGKFGAEGKVVFQRSLKMDW